MPALEIRAPQTSGWLMKEVTLRPQKLERHFLTELACDRETTTFELRSEPDVDAGFDVTSTPAGVSAVRVGPKDDAALGAFELHPEDARRCEPSPGSSTSGPPQLARQTLLSASFDGADFLALPVFAPLVERLVAMLAPIVGEIARRSPTPNELVIRRLLADNRREEIFVGKATLRAKYADLPDAQRALFAPLGLDAPSLPARPPQAREATRPSFAPRLPRPYARRRSRRVRHHPPVRRRRLPFRTRAGSARSPVGPRPDDDMKNAELAKTLRLIFNTARSGRTEYAYGKLADLFSSAAFAGYEPDEQREALRLMVHARNPPREEFVLAAHRAALGHLKRLAETLAEPARLRDARTREPAARRHGRGQRRVREGARARARAKRRVRADEEPDAATRARVNQIGVDGRAFIGQKRLASAEPVEPAPRAAMSERTSSVVAGCSCSERRPG